MKFVDEAIVKVQAGNGGRGCVSFRREKFVPFGGPDGGDGGHGGNVCLRAMEGINTLADFRIQRTFKAKNGEPGSGSECTGRSGEDLYVNVPVGTTVTDSETGEELGDLKEAGQTLIVSRGWQGWIRQPALQVQHQSRTAPVRIRIARGKAHAEFRDEGHCGCGAAGPAQCRQVHADPRGVRGEATRGGLPVHDACIRTSAW